MWQGVQVIHQPTEHLNETLTVRNGAWGGHFIPSKALFPQALTMERDSSELRCTLLAGVAPGQHGVKCFLGGGTEFLQVTSRLRTGTTGKGSSWGNFWAHKQNQLAGLAPQSNSITLPRGTFGGKQWSRYGPSGTQQLLLLDGRTEGRMTLNECVGDLGIPWELNDMPLPGNHNEPHSITYLRCNQTIKL